MNKAACAAYCCWLWRFWTKTRASTASGAAERGCSGGYTLGRDSTSPMNNGGRGGLPNHPPTPYSTWVGGGGAIPDLCQVHLMYMNGCPARGCISAGSSRRGRQRINIERRWSWPPSLLAAPAVRLLCPQLHPKSTERASGMPQPNRKETIAPPPPIHQP